MSSILRASTLIGSSQMNYWKLNFHTTLSNVIQNILDGHYNNPFKIPLDIINFADPNIQSVGVIIHGISLGDGSKVIRSGEDIEACIDGIRGKIGIICEICGEKITIDLKQIGNITVGDTFTRSDLVERQADVDTPDVGFMISSVESEESHVSH